ncbi:MAG: hypothetical protein NC123_05275 [Butyrivibrio sp.]|nr:hypothetical protein [Acetatifactor muris]MCM1558939.1 hypothetical protein [Butyrivibrio sp.]
MDIFMDKLAQQRNAQEIIKANTTAEIQELDMLRSRVAEYNDCLNKLQRLVNEGADGIKSASGESVAEIRRLVEASLAKIREIQQDASGLEKLGKQLEGVGGQMEDANDRLKGMNGRLEDVDGQLKGMDGRLGNLGVQVDSVNGQLGNLNAELSDKMGQLSRQLEENARENPGDRLNEKFAVADENVHKECVKVYRNVQAVVMEESGKQNETLAEISGTLNATKGRLGIVLGISVAALVFSLAGAVLQLLNLLGISLA